MQWKFYRYYTDLYSIRLGNCFQEYITYNFVMEIVICLLTYMQAMLTERIPEISPFHFYRNISTMLSTIVFKIHV
jgi:hypothetical protein